MTRLKLLVIVPHPDDETFGSGGTLLSFLAGLPPASRNQRAPTAGEIPAPVAARSLDHPAAINAQNRCWSSRRAVLGRPGERSLLRPDRSDCRLIGFITTP